jgi:hypothetical protein
MAAISGDRAPPISLSRPNGFVTMKTKTEINPKRIIKAKKINLSIEKNDAHLLSFCK